MQYLFVNKKNASINEILTRLTVIPLLVNVIEYIFCNNVKLNYTQIYSNINQFD